MEDNVKNWEEMFEEMLKKINNDPELKKNYDNYIKSQVALFLHRKINITE